MRIIAIGIVALALIPAAGSAQSAPRSSNSAFAVSPVPAQAVHEQKGPTLESAAVGVRLTSPKLAASAASSARRARRSGIGHAGALIVVGGGAMVAGSFMDGEPGTFFIVGGALVALYGLYLLVQ